MPSFLHGVPGILRDSRREVTQLEWRLSSHLKRQHSGVGGEQLPSDSDHKLVRGPRGACLPVNL